MSQMLSMTGVTVCYDNVEAVRNVSLSVDEGQIVTVIGPNGAGKTTLLMAAIGLLASRGSMVFRGSDIRKMSVEDRVERRLCLVPEKRELFSDMSVADNLLLGSYSLRDRSGVQKTLDEVYDRFPRLKERQRQAAGTLSGGERQMLALGRALMAKPALLMLDEPSLGLAPLIVREIFRTIASLRDLGVSILLVEQNARAALETADYGYVLETGEIVQSGPAKDLIHDPRLIILDEPLTGLDAVSARHVKGLLAERVRRGGTVIMTTHILEVAERMADRIGVIAAGRVLAEGTLAELRQQNGRTDKIGRAHV